jgi:hypothetical protein
MSGVSHSMMRDFRSHTVISIDNRNVVDAVIDPTDAQAGYQLSSAGDVEELTGLGPTVTDVGDWISPKLGMGNYEVRATLNSGTSPTGSALNTWLVLSTSRFWQIQRTTIGTNLSQLLIEIRLASSGVVMDSATIDLEATVEV